MAFVAGLATPEEVAELERRGWDVEEATAYGLVGEGRLMEAPPEGKRAVVVFVATSLFDVMNGPDWEKGP